MNNNNTKHNFIIPYAKPSGVTSFKSMNTVKKIINSKKVGHTGTLDLFADGLLVLLSNQYTRFADLISAGTKEYRAWMEFGKQTETLDPEGEFCLSKDRPTYDALQKSIESFLGKQEQIPPKFSAIKIKGKRASDRIRAGEEIEMKARPIEIFEIEILQVIRDKADKVHFAEIRVRCSKGTYIRSLARDIAEKAQSCAYLRALRRTAVGHFKLEDAIGYSKLPDFSKLGDNFSKEINRQETDLDEASKELFSKAKIFNTELANSLGISCLNLNKKYLFDFQHGKKIRKSWFLYKDKEQDDIFNCEENKNYAVFYNELCIGLVSKENNQFKYQLVFNN